MGSILDNPNIKYTVIMYDLDAPSPDNPIMSPWLHWIKVNWDGHSNSLELSGGGTPYRGPTPPKGVHRYVILVFEQLEGKEPENSNPGNRGKWDLDGFVKIDNLGRCYAANYFLVPA